VLQHALLQITVEEVQQRDKDAQETKAPEQLQQELQTLTAELAKQT
jgi:hypothetical protein